MSTRTYFHCYGCNKTLITKQNLREHSGHLYCSDCIDKMPVQQIIFFDVTYLTKRGLQKETTLRVDTVEEAKQYTLKTLKAKEVLSLTQR